MDGTNRIPSKIMDGLLEPIHSADVAQAKRFLKLFWGTITACELSQEDIVRFQIFLPGFYDIFSVPPASRPHGVFMAWFSAKVDQRNRERRAADQAELFDETVGFRLCRFHGESRHRARTLSDLTSYTEDPNVVIEVVADLSLEGVDDSNGIDTNVAIPSDIINQSPEALCTPGNDSLATVIGDFEEPNGVNSHIGSNANVITDQPLRETGSSSSGSSTSTFSFGFVQRLLKETDSPDADDSLGYVEQILREAENPNNNSSTNADHSSESIGPLLELLDSPGVL